MSTNVTQLNAQPDLDALSEALLEAKKQEEVARIHRVQLEEKIIKAVGIKEEGAQTQKTDRFKVTTTGKLTRSIDWGLYDSLKESIPENLRPVTHKLILDVKGVKYLEANEPQIHKILSQCLTTKPAKPAVSVSRID